MKKSRFEGKRVAVLGLGREGIEAVRFLIKSGALVSVLDGASQKQLANYDIAKKLGVDFCLGVKHLENLEDFDVIVRSPGVALDKPELKRAKRKRVEITSTIKIFFELCPARIIGITGSKGKSTTTSLMAHLISEKGRKVWLGGNIGASPLPALAKIKSTDWVVLELSSFQLEDLTQSPHVAVLLEVVPEHLDRHKTFSRYLSAKQNIYLHQKRTDWLVSSLDFPVTRRALKGAVGKLFEYSTKHVLRRGLYLDSANIIYRDVKTGARTVIAATSEVSLVGRHNLYNILPAIAVAELVGIARHKIAKKLQTFMPLHYRLEPVRKLNGVLFVNDSSATTPEAVEAAVLAFPGEPKALIVGGVSKGGDWTSLAKTIGLGGVEYVALIGTSAKKIKAVFKKFAPKVETEIQLGFKTAIKSCYRAVKGGGVVLLSPGCASFDMFKDAYDRGDKFATIVHSI